MSVRLIVLFAIAFFNVACSNSSDPNESESDDGMTQRPENDANDTNDPDMPVDDANPDAALDADKLDIFRGLTRFSLDTAPAVLAGVSDVLRVSVFTEHINALYAFEQSLLDGSLPLAEAAPEDEDDLERVHMCSGGGRYMATLGDGGGWNGQFSFDTCVVDGIFRNGNYSVQARTVVNGDDSRTDSVTVTIDTLGVSVLGERVDGVFGSMTQQQISTPDNVEFVSSFDFVQYNEIVLVPGAVEPTFAGLLTIVEDGDIIESAAQIVAPDVRYFQTMGANGQSSRRLLIAQDSAILTAAPDLTVVISQAADELALLSDSVSGAYDTGSLELSVSGPQGNRLRLQADNGDADTFDVIIGDDGGSVVSEELSWDDFNPMLFQAPERLMALDDLLAD